MLTICLPYDWWLWQQSRCPPRFTRSFIQQTPVFVCCRYPPVSLSLLQKHLFFIHMPPVPSRIHSSARTVHRQGAQIYKVYQPMRGSQSSGRSLEKTSTSSYTDYIYTTQMVHMGCRGRITGFTNLPPGQLVCR